MALMPMFCGLEAMLRNWVSRWERRVQWRGVTRVYRTRTGTLAEGGEGAGYYYGVARRDAGATGGGRTRAPAGGRCIFFHRPFFMGLGLVWLGCMCVLLAARKQHTRRGGEQAPLAPALPAYHSPVDGAPVQGRTEAAPKAKPEGPRKRSHSARRWAGSGSVAHCSNTVRHLGRPGSSPISP